MKCPECNNPDAFLNTEDGICQPGRNVTVEVRCDKCGESIYGYMIGFVNVDLIVKRNTYVKSI